MLQNSVDFTAVLANHTVQKFNIACNLLYVHSSQGQPVTMGKQLRTVKLYQTRHLLRLMTLSLQMNLLHLQHVQTAPLQLHLQRRSLRTLQPLPLQRQQLQMRKLHLRKLQQLRLQKLRQWRSAVQMQQKAPQSLQMRLLSKVGWRGKQL